MRHQSRSTATIPTLLALICVLLVVAVAPTAYAAAPSPAAARALAREQRVEHRAAERQSRLQAREAKRAARAAQREARKAQREELKAERAAERAARTSAQPGAADTTPTEQPAQTPTPTTGGGGGGEGSTHGEGEAPAQHTSVQRGTCAIAASATPTPAHSGEAVTLVGTLTCPTPAEAGEQTVTVYEHERGAGAGSSTIVGTASTAADGTFQFHTPALSVTSTFTLQTPTARHPGRVVVPVDAGVTLQGPLASGATLAMSASRQAGGPAQQTFTGTIHPEQADRMVALEVRYGAGEWRKVAYTRTDAEGRFSFTHKFRFAGAVSVIAVAHPQGTERAESVPLTYTVAQAQNPAVTIALAPSLAPTTPAPTTPAPTSTPLAPSSAAPAGGSETISGVALDWAHRTVTLLALGADGRYTSVATMLSDAGGAYSFTVDPTATTVYRVACGTQRSAPVRLEVSPPSAAAPTS